MCRPPRLHRLPWRCCPTLQLDPFFEAAAEATEEAILNALVAAETMTGFQGRTVHAMPNDLVRKLVAKSI